MLQLREGPPGGPRLLPGCEVAAIFMFYPAPHVHESRGESTRHGLRVVGESAHHARDTDISTRGTNSTEGPKDELIVPLSLYAVIHARSTSREKTASMLPSLSAHGARCTVHGAPCSVTPPDRRLLRR